MGLEPLDVASTREEGRGTRIADVERLRGLAIAWVVAFHMGVTGFPYGWPGVTLFFVISGFVVTCSLLRGGLGVEPGPLREAVPALQVFYIRRFYRLAPAAAVSILLTGEVMALLSGEWTGGHVELLRETASIFTGTYNYALGRGGSGHLFWFWSLLAEEHFYLFLPLVLVLVPHRRVQLLLCGATILALALVYRPLAIPVGIEIWPRYHAPTHLHVDAFLGGVVLALLRFEGAGLRPILPRSLLQFGLVPLVLGAVYLAAGMPDSHPMRLAAVAAGSTLLVALASANRDVVLAVPIVGPFLAYLGSRSYALYLVHMPSIVLTQHAFGLRGGPPHVALGWMTGALLMLGVAELTHRLVEEPLRLLGVRLTSKTPLMMPGLPSDPALGVGLFLVATGVWQRLLAVPLAGGSQGVAEGLFVLGIACTAGRLLTLRHRLAWAAVVVLGLSAVRVAMSATRPGHAPTQPGPPRVDAPVTWVASSQGWGAPLQGTSSEAPRYFFHTQQENHPWVELTLATPAQVDEIEIINRRDCCRDRALPLVVEVAAPDGPYQALARQPLPFETWRIKVGQPIRALRLSVDGNTFFHLAAVRILRTEPPRAL